MIPIPLASPLPDVIDFTLSGRSYRAPRVIADGEMVTGRTMIVRAEEKKATLGEEDGQWFLAHQDEINAQIPLERRGDIVFVFIDWLHPDGDGRIAGVYWRDGAWKRGWGGLYFGSMGHRPVGRIA